MLLIDTRPAPAYWPPDLDQTSDREAAELTNAFVTTSERLLVLVKHAWGMPSRN